MLQEDGAEHVLGDLVQCGRHPGRGWRFAVWDFFLSPAVGALLMSLSTVVVAINAMLLWRMRLG